MKQLNVPPMEVDEFELMQYPRGDRPALAAGEPDKPTRRRSLATGDGRTAPVSEPVTVPPAGEPAAGEQPPTPPAAETKKRTTRRQKKQAAQEPAAANGLVYLTPEQLGKLWQAVTGGRVEITGDTSRVVITVTLNSFEKALPALLERL